MSVHLSSTATSQLLSSLHTDRVLIGLSYISFYEIHRYICGRSKKSIEGQKIKKSKNIRVKKKKMGSFLDKPITTKFTEFRETKDFVWVVASMQGWRAEMEDAHVCISEECGESEHHFFGVFDGHGGKKCSETECKRFVRQSQR